MKKFIALFAGMLAVSLFVQAQTTTTMAVKDLSKDIEKYIKNHYENHQTVEAYRHNTVYLMKAQQGDSTIQLVFNKDGDFQSMRAADFDDKVSIQPRTTMSLKDVDKSITKYIKKSHEGFTLTEALRYDEVYVVKLMKDTEILWLLFNSKGEFMEKSDK